MAISMAGITHDAGNRLSGRASGSNYRLSDQHRSLSVHTVRLI